MRGGGSCCLCILHVNVFISFSDESWMSVIGKVGFKLYFMSEKKNEKFYKKSSRGNKN